MKLHGIFCSYHQFFFSWLIFCCLINLMESVCHSLFRKFDSSFSLSLCFQPDGLYSSALWSLFYGLWKRWLHSNSGLYLFFKQIAALIGPDASFLSFLSLWISRVERKQKIFCPLIFGFLPCCVCFLDTPDLVFLFAYLTVLFAASCNHLPKTLSNDTKAK